MKLRWLLLLKWSEDDPNSLGRVDGWMISAGARNESERAGLARLGEQMIKDPDLHIAEYLIVDTTSQL